MKKILIIIISCACFLTTNYAQPGMLDVSFDTDGIVVTDVDSNWDIAYDIALQNDGKIVAAGLVTIGAEYTMGVFRYFTNGSLDTSFGNGGIVSIDFDTASQFNEAYSVAIQPDGKIIVAGSAEINADRGFAVARLNVNGSLDNSFDGDGKKVVQLGVPGYMDAARKVLMDASGNIILVGDMQTTSWGRDFALLKLHTNGSIDTTFGLNGVASANFSGLDDVAHASVILMDGRIAVGGTTMVFSNTDYGLAVFTANGILDNSFSGNGRLNTDFGAGNDEAFDIKQQGDGKILLAGSSTIFTSKDITAARYLLNGDLDTNFSNNGKFITTINTSGDDEARSILIQPDNYFILGGYTTNSSSSDFALLRIDYNGIPDSSFGTNALVTTNILGGQYNEIYDLAIQSDYKILAAGITATTDIDVALTRYETELQIGVENQDPIKEFYVYPNPVVNNFTVEFNSSISGNVNVELFNTNGQLITTYLNQEWVDAGYNQLKLSLPINTPPGIYYLVIGNDKYKTSIKIIH